MDIKRLVIPILILIAVGYALLRPGLLVGADAARSTCTRAFAADCLEDPKLIRHEKRCFYLGLSGLRAVDVADTSCTWFAPDR